MLKKMNLPLFVEVFISTTRPEAQGQVMLLDVVDADLVKGKVVWLRGAKHQYPSICVEGKLVLVHKLVAERMGLDTNRQVDHISRNTLDNRRSNLRSASNSENGWNAKRSKNNTSGFKGCYYEKARKKWAARISVDNKRIFLGYYDVLVECAIAYDRAAVYYFGEFACTNASLGLL